jgi:hypothetical protein
MSNASSGLYTFGSYRLDAASRVLTRSGTVVTLGPKTFDLLILRAESGGRLLSKRIEMEWATVEEGGPSKKRHRETAGVEQPIQVDLFVILRADARATREGLPELASHSLPRRREVPKMCS